MADYTTERTLVRDIEDAHGRKIAVYADIEGVTLDFGLTDRNLTLNGAAELMVALNDAISASALRAAAHAD